MEITDKILTKIVAEQDVVALGLVTPKGLPHTTPIWINNYKGNLYMFSRSTRAKTIYASKTDECMIAFKWASLRGKIEVHKRGSLVYEEVKDIFDDKYGEESGYPEYKKNWNVVLKVIPYKLFRN